MNDYVKDIFIRGFISVFWQAPFQILTGYALFDWQLWVMFVGVLTYTSVIEEYGNHRRDIPVRAPQSR